MSRAARTFLLGSALALGVACGGKTVDDAAPDAASDAAGECTPGAKKPQDCNTCTCGEDRQWWCTTMGCRDAAHDDVCRAGETKSPDGCTVCVCSASNAWVCDDTACRDAGFDAGFDVGRDPRCPASWSAATSGTHDDLCAAGVSCAYAEGSCSCPEYCGGPPPGPDWKPTWTCSPKPPPRTDGCPDAELTDGAPCTSPGKWCSYGRSCCLYGYKCTDGRWVQSGPICPP